MKKKFYLLLALLGLAGVSMQAQNMRTSWNGIRFSADYSHQFSDYPFYDGMDYGGFSLGYEHAFRISRKLPLHLVLGGKLTYARHSDDATWTYVEEGFASVRESAEWKVNRLNISIPISLAYAVKLNRNLTLKPFTGFDIRFNLLAKGDFDATETYRLGRDSYTEVYSKNINYFDKGDTYVFGGKFNRMALDWHFGAMLDIKKHWTVGLRGAVDMSRTAPDTHTFVMSAVAGYNF